MANNEVFTLVGSLQLDTDHNSAKQAGKQAAKIVEKELTKVSQGKLSEGISNSISKGISDGFSKGGLKSKAALARLQHDPSAYVAGTKQKLRQANNYLDKVGLTKLFTSKEYDAYVRRHTTYGTGGIGRDYKGVSTDYSKLIADAVSRNSNARSNIARKAEMQSMYESLWGNLDSGKATVFSRDNVVSGNKFGMAIDVVKSKLKSLVPDINNIATALKPIKVFMGRLGRIAIYRAIRSALKAISQSIREGVNNLYQWSKLQSSSFGNQFAQSLDKIASSLLLVKDSIATVIAPIITALTPAIERLASAFNSVSESIAQFLATLMGTGYYTKAIKNNIEYASSVGEIKKQLMGFDELNVLNGQSSGSSIKDYNNLFETVVMDDTLERAIAEKMTIIGAIMSGSLLALGAILTFTGANIPLGLGLMVSGALLFGKTLSTNWDYMTDKVKEKVATITSLVSLSLLAVGAILAFSGAKVALGIGLMAAGAIGLASVAQLNWDSVSEQVRNTVSKILGIVSAAALVIGCLLLADPTKWPLAFGLIAAGAAGLVTTAVINWDAIKNKLSEVWQKIKAWFNTDVKKYLSYDYWKQKATDLMNGFAAGIDTGKTKLAQTLNKEKSISGNYSAIDAEWNKANQTMKNTLSDLLNIKLKASGGAVDTGSLFLAGEAGPELVTQVGGRSTVYNEEQLGNSLAYANEGVIQAINTLIGVVRTKSNNVTISASDIRKAVNNSSMRVGV